MNEGCLAIKKGGDAVFFSPGSQGSSTEHAHESEEREPGADLPMETALSFSFLHRPFRNPARKL